MAKVEVIKDGWGGHEKGFQFETPKSTAKALEAHKVVKIIEKDKYPDPEKEEDEIIEKDKKAKTIKSEK